MPNSLEKNVAFRKKKARNKSKLRDFTVDFPLNVNHDFYLNYDLQGYSNDDERKLIQLAQFFLHSKTFKKKKNW